MKAAERDDAVVGRGDPGVVEQDLGLGQVGLGGLDVGPAGLDVGLGLCDPPTAAETGPPRRSPPPAPGARRPGRFVLPLLLVDQPLARRRCA